MLKVYTEGNKKFIYATNNISAHKVLDINLIGRIDVGSAPYSGLHRYIDKHTDSLFSFSGEQRLYLIRFQSIPYDNNFFDEACVWIFINVEDRDRVFDKILTGK